jgi:hypothetical protein
VNIDRRLMQVGGFLFLAARGAEKQQLFTTMLIELMWCQAVLRRWSEGPPDRPIYEINIWQYPKDTRTRPYSPE